VPMGAFVCALCALLFGNFAKTLTKGAKRFRFLASGCFVGGATAAIALSLYTVRSDTPSLHLYCWTLAFGLLVFLYQVGFLGVDSNLLTFVVPLLLITGFSKTVYPDIPSGWGGAKPQPVEVLLSSTSFSPWLRVNRFLLDETDTGYYLADTPDGRVQFIPRGQVSLLTFRPANFASRSQR